MAKLVDLLAKHLKEWPDGAEYVGQCSSGFVYTNSDVFVIGFGGLAEDWETAIVAKSQYLAARDRLHAETVKEMHEPTNADTDQAIWDKVAVAALGAMASSQGANDDRMEWMGYIAEDACMIADAFMAERAKRLKKAQAHEN